MGVEGAINGVANDQLEKMTSKREAMLLRRREVKSRAREMKRSGRIGSGIPMDSENV
jgi:hypothetical protein